MLYHPFTKDETLVMPDFSKQSYAEGYLTIQPNPLLNPLTYCVSNKDLNSLMKKLSEKNNSTRSIRGAAAASKKAKQSVKRASKNLQSAGASEKVRKSTAQAKAQ